MPNKKLPEKLEDAIDKFQFHCIDYGMAEDDTEEKELDKMEVAYNVLRQEILKFARKK